MVVIVIIAYAECAQGGIAVTEFGISEPYEALRKDLPSIVTDPIRSAYYRDYLEAILIAISEGVNVVGTLAWSIYDNFEWGQGYSSKFGIQVCSLLALRDFCLTNCASTST